MSFTNTTVVDNGGASSRGGGIHNGGATLTLTNDTLSGNIRGSLLTDQGASTAVQNTIIGDGFSDGSTSPASPAGYSDEVNDRTTGQRDHDRRRPQHRPGRALRPHDASDISGKDPMLAPIADNGGRPLTQALLAEARRSGTRRPRTVPGDRPTGQPRPTGSCDIGAFEAGLRTDAHRQHRGLDAGHQTER